jgi:hypothetical protein
MLLAFRNLPLVKVTHRDLLKLGIVTSRFDQHVKIKAGKLRAPHKGGDTMQAAAWWWWHEVCDDLEREMNSQLPDQAA